MDVRYRNDPKFSDRLARANSADLDQTKEQSDQGLTLFVIPSCSTFRVITANFRMSEILGILRQLSLVLRVEETRVPGGNY